MSEFYNNQEIAAFGVKLVHLIAGVAGGVVRSLVIGRYGIIAATSAVIVGGLTAGYGTPAATSILCKWLSNIGYRATGLDGAVGFTLGLCGMTTAEIAIQQVREIGKKLRKIANQGQCN
ncbi:hypothetical protein [Pseudochelatococcus sp. G4_1912]|uniref:hypothetical protein n=1 Tax=Pseudochelatococcus sp. G4_1912 TaxID=3114288 RepID=UPI0039C76330